jgi:hypothetical protein
MNKSEQSYSVGTPDSYSVGTPGSYQLPQTTAVFGKRTVIQISPLKRISVIYGKRMFITVLTTADHWSVS